MAMMISRVARVNSSHPYLENDPSSSLAYHRLRISPWLRFRCSQGSQPHLEDGTTYRPLRPTCATGSTVPDAVDNPGPHSAARKRLADSSNSRGLARLAVSEKPSSTGRPRRNASMSRTEA